MSGSSAPHYGTALLQTLHALGNHGPELDHLISLELGGSPDDVANLWPEPWTGDANAHQKDAVETHLKTEVCRGAVALADAQRIIATDWYAVFNSNGLQRV